MSLRTKLLIWAFPSSIAISYTIVQNIDYLVILTAAPTTPEVANMNKASQNTLTCLQSSPIHKIVKMLTHQLTMLMRLFAILTDRHTNIDTDLLFEKLGQGGAVPQVHPVSGRGVLLLMLTFTKDDVIVTLGARHGRREPDLLVGGLLVDHIGAGVLAKVYGHDTSLEIAC